MKAMIFPEAPGMSILHKHTEVFTTAKERVFCLVIRATEISLPLTNSWHVTSSAYRDWFVFLQVRFPFSETERAVLENFHIPRRKFPKAFIGTQEPVEWWKRTRLPEWLYLWRDTGHDSHAPSQPLATPHALPSSHTSIDFLSQKV